MDVTTVAHASQLRLPWF